MSQTFTDEFSVVDHKVKLYALVKSGRIDTEVVDCLIPNGTPLDYERQLWDYKVTPPPAASPNLSTEDKAKVDAAWAGLIKDIISFYNSYGGYIVFGVSDSPRKVTGCSDDFDVDELNRRVAAYVKTPIECHYRLLPATPSNPTGPRVGLLLIPQRPDQEGIALIRKDGPKLGSSKPAFSKNAIYLRKGDSCCPADDPDDFLFLTSAGRRALSFAVAKPANTAKLFHNLPPRDPSFIQFVGRHANVVDLWRWFLDPFTPVKLVAGIGGVGKTTLVREFTENLVRTAPSGIEKVVWLSAKQRVFTAIQGKYEVASRVDFYNVDSLLRALLSELGELDATLDELTDIEDLVDSLVNILGLIPAFVVIDDLDSLPLESQQEAFHVLIQLFTRVAALSKKPSKCVVTARLDLGASPSQLLRIKGLDLPDFADFVELNSKSIELPLNFSATSSLMKRFWTTTDGSPTFAAAILRLMSYGETVESSLARWKGSDGEEVRKFAFERELNNLTDSHIRTLYAASVLGESYLDELHVILATSLSLLQDQVAELRKYHLVSSGQATSQGISLVVPGAILLMRDVIRKRVKDPKRIDDECARLRASSTDRSLVAKRIVQRVVALWYAGEPEIALETAEQGVKENPTNGNLSCLLGRAYLRTSTPDHKRAELAFRDAHKLGCSRTELLELWLEAKVALEDWLGILEITQMVPGEIPSNTVLMHRASAYRQLAMTARSANNFRGASDYYKKGGDEIDIAFKQKRAVGNVLELREFRSEFFSSYVQLVNLTSQREEDHLEVWLAVCDSFDAYVRRPFLIKLGLERLASWWNTVCRRDALEIKALNLVESQSRKARSILAWLTRVDSPNIDLIDFTKDQINLLENSIASYRKQHKYQ